MIPFIETYRNEDLEKLKDELCNKLLDFTNAINFFKPETRKDSFKAAYRGVSWPEPDSFSNLTSTPPKLLTFYFEYKNYFDNYETKVCSGALL